jgi:MFS family permease
LNESIPPSKTRWINRTVVGIILATFLSDVSHEMCTAVLPLYLATISLGPAALGVMEGLADLLMSVSRLAGGVVGHHVHRKRPWTALGYLTTTLATAGLALVHGLAALVSLRGIAWIGRGFRSPLRDFMLADAVEPTHFGRAYGLERAGDMLGAVVGPLLAAAFIWGGVEFRTLLLWTLVPGLAAAAAIMFLARDRTDSPTMATAKAKGDRPRFPHLFWMFLMGVFLFGLGDFSRTFLVLLAAMGLRENSMPISGVLPVAVLLYALHNAVSALAAYPAGHLGDRSSKLSILVVGYGIGVATNLILAIFLGSLGWLIAAIVLSGIYIAVEETLEKAVAADLLPRELRSLGFGILACVNAVGDMVSSLYVGYCLEIGRPAVGFGFAAAAGSLGLVWLLAFVRLRKLPLDA